MLSHLRLFTEENLGFMKTYISEEKFHCFIISFGNTNTWLKASPKAAICVWQ